MSGTRERFVPGTRSFRVGRLAFAAILALAYLLVVVAYAQSTVGAGVQVRTEPPDDGVSLHFVPTALDANAGSMTGLMYVFPGANLVDTSRRLTQDLTVDVAPVLGPGSVTFGAGQALTPLSIVLAVDGHVRNYPFDSYAVNIVSSVETRTSPAAPWTPVPVVVGAEGELGGWVLSFAAPPSVGVGGLEFTTSDGYGIQTLGARRAVSTVALAILILLLMMLLAALTVLVTRAVTHRRRRVEPTLAGWMAALLFALVPLRQFLPGAPPLGSWIDVLVFFWVEIVIMLALAAYIATWLRDGKPSDRQPD